MKNRRFSQSTGPKWLRRIILLLLVVFIVCLAFGIYLYQDIMEQKTTNFDETRKIILEQTSISKVDDIDVFHGDEAYHVVYGTNDKDEERIIFYPIKGKKKEITTVKSSEIVHKDEILDSWKSACMDCQFVKITPALIKDNILWEITYFDEKDRYVIDYFSIYDGSIYEQYRFKRMFN